METTEHKIYSCLAEIAKMDRIALILSTQAPTPELLLEFLQSVIAAEHEKRSASNEEEPEIDVHILKAVDSLASVQ